MVLDTIRYLVLFFSGLCETSNLLFVISRYHVGTQVINCLLVTTRWPANPRSYTGMWQGNRSYGKFHFQILVPLFPIQVA